ncbi:hypothetical protein HPY27_04365 [Brevibacillus sp. HB1.1]|uniref:hypothetical protein n=1 Tax=Brevibacillus sp. HB1.1 TaxID=2738808 RepID=UPI001576082E|nr:hypothetical protein [Brevibacillus sp. HB1.1]NTU29398.1 hypothetical protein [Brevibacillus sp. HB1.1]
MRKALNKNRWLSMICMIALVTGCQHEPNKPITSENAGKTTEATAKPIPAPLPTSSPVSTAPTNQPMEEQQKESLSPYQVLNKIREIEKVKGGTYQGEWKEDEYTFHLPDKDGDRRNARYYERSTHHVKVYGKDGLKYFYHLFDPATYPLTTLETESIQVNPETWQQMNKIEQKLYTSEDTFHAEWSPNFQAVAYYKGTTEDGQAYIWKVGNDSPSPIKEAVIDRYFFTWSPDSEYLLLDTGTSRHRGGQIYQVANDRMSEPFSYISQFRFSPDSIRAAFSQLSGIISKEKYGMEDEETEDIWLYELSTGKQKKLLQADDHTDYFPLEWKSETELLYWKQDYQKNTEEELTVTIPQK